MNKFLVTLLCFWNDVTNPPEKEKGATATEYAMLVALIAIAIVGAVGLFGTNLRDWWNAVAARVGGWAS